MMGSSNSIHEAVTQGKARKLQRLLKKDASNVNDMHLSETPLIRAVRAKQIELVSILLKYNADPNVLCRVFPGRTQESESYAYDWTAMHEAAIHSESEMMELLVSHGGDMNLLFENSQRLLPPLHIAAWYGRTEIVKTLVNAGCDVNQLDCYHESPIVLPICQGDTEMVELLLNSGCKLNSRAWGNLRKTLVGRSRRRIEELFNRPGPYSLLTFSILRAWPHIAIMLLQHGYDWSKCEIYGLVKAVQDSDIGMGKLAHQVIACYLAAGYTPRRGDSKLMDNLLLPPNEGFDPEYLEWIKSHFGIHSLEHLCRTRIRSIMRQVTENASIMARLKQLSAFLPPSLVDYLTLAEFSVPDTESYRQLPCILSELQPH